MTKKNHMKYIIKKRMPKKNNMIDKEFDFTLSFVKDVLLWDDKDIQRVKDDVKRDPRIKVEFIKWLKEQMN